MKTIEYDDAKAIKKLFVGRKIVSADKDQSTMTLDNGTVLEIVPNQGSCCSSGDYWLKEIASFDNAIMNVEVVESTEENYTVYSIFVYAEGIETANEVATIEGDDGSGYYGSGFTIQVVEVEA